MYYTLQKTNFLIDLKPQKVDGSKHSQFYHYKNKDFEALGSLFTFSCNFLCKSHKTKQKIYRRYIYEFDNVYLKTGL